MIYIKNNTEIQTIYIPRNELQKEVYNTTIKTYEDGYKEGFDDGKEEQKDQLLNLYVTENGTYERNDGFGIVTVDVPTQGKEPLLGTIKRTLTKNDRYVYEPTNGLDGFKKVDITVDVPTEDVVECNLQIKHVELAQLEKNEWGSYTILPDEGYDGMSDVSVGTSMLEEEKYNEGFGIGYNQGFEGGKADTSDVQSIKRIDITEKNKLDTISADEPYEFMRRVKINTEILEQERYNAGYAAGIAEGGEGDCEGVFENGYNAGYLQGKSECEECEECVEAELGVLDITLEEPYTQVFDAKERDGVDGYSVVNIRPEGLVEREKNNAVEAFKNAMASVTITENGSYGIDYNTNYPYLDYENVNGYTEFNYTPYNENFEIEVSYSLGEANTVMHLVDIGEYSVVLEAGMCYGTKNDERISPYHMSWGNDNKTIHTIKVTREGITLLEDGSFISWGEDLGTISSNVKVGRDFTSKIFTVKMNGDTLTPEGDGVFRNSFAVGETARYGELEVSDYPNGFRNVEVNVEERTPKQGVKFGHSKFEYCPYDISGLEDYRFMFDDCQNLIEAPNISTPIINAHGMFAGCVSMQTAPSYDTSLAIDLNSMYGGCYNLISVGAVYCDSLPNSTIGWNREAQIFGTNQYPYLTDFGGFIGLKQVVDLKGLIALNEQSVLNIFSGLYDFNANMETPNSIQGKIYMSSHITDIVERYKYIAENKGWTVEYR